MSENEEENYESIADRLLMQLQSDYYKVQSFNLKTQEPELKLEKSSQKHQLQANSDEQQCPQGYQKFNMDDNQVMSDGSDERSGNDNEGQQQINEENNEEVIGDNNQSNSPHQNYTVELIEVGPVPDSLFSVPEPQDKIIDEVKIKQFALSMSIETPQWAKNPETLEKRIRQLFNSKPASGICKP